MTTYDPTKLPKNLPVPEDDGAADHLQGLRIPQLMLASTQGRLDLSRQAEGLIVLYVYPRTGRPGVKPPRGWNQAPGARGCTPQSCGYRDLGAELHTLGARVIGASSQTLDEQREATDRLGISHPVIADPDFQLADALDLPTFEFRRTRLYKRLALVAERGRIEKVFYPVFPPDENAAEVLAWLSASRS